MTSDEPQDPDDPIEAHERYFVMSTIHLNNMLPSQNRLKLQY